MRSRARIVLTMSTILLQQIVEFETMSGHHFETNETMLERLRLSRLYLHLDSRSKTV
jgi:hypothetical protein